MFACVMVVLRYSMDIAGEFAYYNDSGPAAMAKCILLHGANLINVGNYGAIACIVVITFDRYWKIVHPVHHRKYYRPWMLKVWLFLPWLNGVSVRLLPASGTTRIAKGKCFAGAFWPTDAMLNVCCLFHCLNSFCCACVGQYVSCVKH